MHDTLDAPEMITSISIKAGGLVPIKEPAPMTPPGLGTMARDVLDHRAEGACGPAVPV